jgi:hypothetical protein
LGRWAVWPWLPCSSVRHCRVWPRHGRAKPRSSRQWPPAARVGWPRLGASGRLRVTVTATAGVVACLSPCLVLLLAKPRRAAVMHTGESQGCCCHCLAIMARTSPPDLPTMVNALVCPTTCRDEVDDPGHSSHGMSLAASPCSR